MTNEVGRLPVYENLDSAELRKTLGLSADQERQLSDIASNAQAELLKIHQEEEKVDSDFRSADDVPARRDQTEKQLRQKMFELRRETWKLNKNVREKIEALLTPQQLAAVRENLFGAPGSRWPAFGEFQARIGLNEQEKAEIRRIDREFQEEYRSNVGELWKKSLEVLAPEQQEKLRAELDRRGW